MEWFYDHMRRRREMAVNVNPEEKSDIQVSLVNKNVESMHYQNNKDWVGHGNFPSYLKPGGEPIIFTAKQPLKTGIIYQGINKHKVPCAWLLAFTALGGGTTVKVYVSAGKLEKFNNVKWGDVSFKLVEGDASIEHVDPATGCHAKAKIEICSSTQGGQVVHLSAVFDSDRYVGDGASSSCRFL